MIRNLLLIIIPYLVILYIN